MTFSRGRSRDYNDDPVVRAITRDASKQNYKFTAAVVCIANRAPFQIRT